jgi:hypothetical protein
MVTVSLIYNKSAMHNNTIRDPFGKYSQHQIIYIDQKDFTPLDI